MTEFEAINLLTSLGYEVKLKKKPAPIPNGCFRVEFNDGGVRFIEGREEDMEELRASWDGLEYWVTSIEFKKDRFYFQ